MKLENVKNVATLQTRVMNAFSNLAAQTWLFTSYNERTISFRKEGSPADFSCKNRTASAQAYDLVTKTLETFAKGLTPLQVTRNKHMLSTTADFIRKTNPTASRGKPRKRDLMVFPNRIKKRGGRKESYGNPRFALVVGYSVK